MYKTADVHISRYIYKTANVHISRYIYKTADVHISKYKVLIDVFYCVANQRVACSLSVLHTL